MRRITGRPIGSRGSKRPSLGEAILAARMARDWPQDLCARQIGVTQGMINKWEKGAMPNTRHLPGILDALPELEGGLIQAIRESVGRERGA